MASGKEDNKEEYSLAKLPSASSQIVVEVKESMLSRINLEALVDDLGRLGNCVRIAYHGVAGYTDLQIEIQRIGYDVTKLCEKSAFTVSRFKKSSETVLQTLQATYDYLLDNLEDMAIETLADVADTAKGMAEAAESLHNEFDKQAQVVVEALEKTQRQHGTEEKKKKEIVEERKKMEEDKVRVEALHNQAQEAAKQSENYFLQAKRREEEALRQQHDVADNSGFFKFFVNTLFGVVFTKPSHHRDVAEAAKQEKMKHLQAMYEQEKIRKEAIVQLAQYAKRIQNIKVGESQIEAAIEALLNAIVALKSLSAVMLQAAQFWQYMQHHCQDLAKDEIKKELERALKKPPEERLRVYKSKGFTNKALQYYAEWTALDYVCTRYRERIELTQRELYSYIREALPPDKAREKVKELAHKLSMDLKKEQDAIEAKQTKQKQEIDSLKLQLKDKEDQGATQ